MKTKSICIAVATALAVGGTMLPAAAGTVENVKTSTGTAVDNAIDKLPPKRALSRAEYSAEKERIEGEYKSADATCGPMSGNAKAVCHVQARSDEKVKFSDLEAQYKATPAADIDARVTRAKAQYNVAKQKCEDRPAAEKTACRADAKAEESRAISDAKAAKTAAIN